MSHDSRPTDTTIDNAYGGLVEQPHTDFADAVLRVAVFAAWRLALLDQLCGSTDPVLAAVAEKGVKEVRYHLDYASRWVAVLAGGTDHSKERVDQALHALWPFVPELWTADDVTAGLVSAGVAADPHLVAEQLDRSLAELLAEAGLPAPPPHAAEAHPPGRTGRAGVHTHWLPPLLEEMQGLARAHPMGRW